MFLHKPLLVVPAVSAATQPWQHSACQNGCTSAGNQGRQHWPSRRALAVHGTRATDPPPTTPLAIAWPPDMLSLRWLACWIPDPHVHSSPKKLAQGHCTLASGRGYQPLDVSRRCTLQGRDPAGEACLALAVQERRRHAFFRCRELTISRGLAQASSPGSAHQLLQNEFLAPA